MLPPLRYLIAVGGYCHSHGVLAIYFDAAEGGRLDRCGELEGRYEMI